MNTMNISVTPAQTQLVDNLTQSFDFANRSEFFRALLRFVEWKPEVLKQSGEMFFRSPDTKSTKKVVDSMRATGQYSKEFLMSLKKGLLKSGYFTK